VAPRHAGRRARLAALALALAAALGAGGYVGWDHYRARREWREAESALARRDLAAAAAHLDRYRALRPEDPAGWFQSARAARRRGQFADAKHDLAECERLGGPTDATRLERDLLLVQQGILGEADVRLRATVGPDHPDAPFVLEALARGYILAERWPDARQACELWRAVQPEHPWPWLWAGWIAERLIDMDRAAELYRRAVELAPDDRDARVAFARVLLRQRDPAAAAAHYQWVLERDPEDAEALLGLAQCRVEAGRAGEAVPMLDRVLARDPSSALAAALRGRAAMEGGDPAGAERWLRQAVRADAGDAESLHLLVQCLRAQRRDAEAEPLAARLESLQKDLRRLAELVRTITPQLADAAPCHEAGVIALRVGRAKQGAGLLQEALRRKGDHRPTHAALADYYRRAGDAALAQFHLSLADSP
jgi:tetratricopeptide (TPR) repeat protein